MFAGDTYFNEDVGAGESDPESYALVGYGGREISSAGKLKLLL